MSFCTQCGTRMGERERFCSTCGAGVEDLRKPHRKSRGPWLWIFSLVAIAIIATAGLVIYYQTETLPEYLERTGDDTILVNLEGLTGGKAWWVEEEEKEDSHLMMVFGPEESILTFSAVSYKSGLTGGTNKVRLEEPPILVAPVMDPEDGAAGIYAVGWVDEEGEHFHFTWLVETSWKDLVGDELYLHAGAMFEKQSQAIDLSEAEGPVIKHTFTFELEHSSEVLATRGGIYALATNVDKEFHETLQAIQRLKLDLLGEEAAAVIATN